LLAREGTPVEVFDRRSGGGGRFHGGWQVLENSASELDALAELGALGLAAGCEAIPARRASFFGSRPGERFEVVSREPYAYFIRRGSGAGSLDAVLRAEAHSAGVRLRDGEAAPAGAEIIATGPRQADGVARETTFSADLPDTVAVLFDPEVTPTGYAYLFCLGGRGTFGVAQVRGVKHIRKSRERAWERFRRELGSFPLRSEHESGQYMGFAIPRHLRSPDGRWHVGEAAGVQDFLYGLGNRLALRSAALAAAGVAGRWDERGFIEQVVRPMRTSVALRFLYERAGARASASFCRRAAGADFRSFLRRLQQPVWAKDLLAMAVMARWRARGGCRHGELCSWCRARER
ncbi:MAG: hypothetical protein V1750_07185, partial [Acidobacteriota bacterium]